MHWRVKVSITEFDTDGEDYDREGDDYDEYTAAFTVLVASVAMTSPRASDSFHSRWWPALEGVGACHRAPDRMNARLAAENALLHERPSVFCVRFSSVLGTFPMHL